MPRAGSTPGHCDARATIGKLHDQLLPALAYGAGIRGPLALIGARRGRTQIDAFSPPARRCRPQARRDRSERRLLEGIGAERHRLTIAGATPWSLLAPATLPRLHRTQRCRRPTRSSGVGLRPERRDRRRGPRRACRSAHRCAPPGGVRSLSLAAARWPRPVARHVEACCEPQRLHLGRRPPAGHRGDIGPAVGEPAGLIDEAGIDPLHALQQCAGRPRRRGRHPTMIDNPSTQRLAMISTETLVCAAPR